MTLLGRSFFGARPRLFAGIADKSSMRNQGIFLVFILCLTLGLTLASQAFHEHYSDSQDLHAQILQLNEQREKEALKVTLLQNQMEDLKAHVYETLGHKTSLAWNEKQWLSSLRGPASVTPPEPKSGTLLANAKKDFLKKNFAAAGEKLKQSSNFIRQAVTSLKRIFCWPSLIIYQVRLRPAWIWSIK